MQEQINAIIHYCQGQFHTGRSNLSIIDLANCDLDSFKDYLSNSC